MGDTYGPAVDLWALGCIFVELLTGRPLFPGKTQHDQLWLVLRAIGSLTDRQVRAVAVGDRSKTLYRFVLHDVPPGPGLWESPASIRRPVFLFLLTLFWHLATATPLEYDCLKFEWCLWSQMKVMRLDDSYKCFRAPTKAECVPLDTQLVGFSGPMMEVVRACLQPNADKRVTAAQLVQMSFFEGVHDALPPQCRSVCVSAVMAGQGYWMFASHWAACID